MTHRTVVGAVIVDDLVRPTRVLAARRSRPADLAGRWEFPGGKVEAGESPRHALRRELAEELAVEVVLGRELRPAGGGAWPISAAYELRLFRAAIVGAGASVGDSHDALRWLTPATLDSVDWLGADRRALPAVFG